MHICWKMSYYRPQTKFGGKVMFYTCLSICPREGRSMMSLPVSGHMLFPEEVSVRRDPDLPPHTVDERRVCILLECFLLLLFVYLLLSLTSGFLYAIREAIVNDLVEYDLNGSDYVSCIVGEEYKDTAKYFIFIDIFILFLIPLIIIVSNYARVGFTSALCIYWQSASEG